MKTILVILIISMSLPSFAGYILTRTSGAEYDKTTSTSYIQDGLLRELGDDELIIDFNKKEMIQLNMETKKYWQ